MAKLPVFDMAGKSAGDLELSDTVFGAEYNQGLIHQIFVGLQANARHGTADTKTRGEVRGGGRKPWRQKGTGMARQGSRRAPNWKGGGTVFGPHPRKYTQALPKKMRHAALRSALSQRVRENAVTALSELALEEFKTKRIVEMLTALKLTLTVRGKKKAGEHADGERAKARRAVANSTAEIAIDGSSSAARTLLVLEAANDKVQKSAANLPGVTVVLAANLNLVDVVLSHRVLATKAALKKIEEVLS